MTTTTTTAKKWTKVTVERLYEYGACVEHIDLFQRLFPEGVEPTRALCVRYADRLNIGWAALKFLGDETRDQYDAEIESTKKELEKVLHATGNVYEKARTAANKVWRDRYAKIAKMRTITAARATTLMIAADEIREKKLKKMAATRDAERKPAFKTFRRAVGIAFWNAWKRDRGL